MTWPAPLGILTGLGLAATTAVAGWLTLASLRWPLVHDGPLMQFVATRILHGAVPYRDLFDMNFPGVYLVHLAALRVFGPGDLGFRAFDLTLLVAIVAGLVVALAPFDWRAALTGGALFWLYHLAGGAWRAGQRDLIACVPLAWMAAAAVRFVETRRLRGFGLAGLCLGMAVWIKPHAMLLVPVLVALAWSARSRGRALAVAGLAVAVPAVPVLAWLAASGALAPFVDILGGYLIPLYAHVGRVSPVTAVREHYLGAPVLGGLVLWAGAGVMALARTGRVDGRLGVLAAGVAYGVLHYVVQGKGWEYHLYPLALFLIATGAAGLGAAMRLERGPMVLVLLVTLGATVWILALKGGGGLDPGWIVEKERRVRAVAAELAPVVAAGGAVQVFDTAEGGIHALYLLGAREPTRFLYDFHFYHDVDHPYVRRLREELLDGLRARPPAAVVVFERGWPMGGYERLERFPALHAWLDAGYALADEGDAFRIYRRRP